MTEGVEDTNHPALLLPVWDDPVRNRGTVTLVELGLPFLGPPSLYPYPFRLGPLCNKSLSHTPSSQGLLLGSEPETTLWDVLFNAPHKPE